MKARLFFLYVLFAFLIVILLGALIWPFLRVDERLRDLLIQQVDPTFDGTVELRQVHLSLASLSLHGLEILPKDEMWSLQIERALISFSLWKYFQGGLSLQNSITGLDIQSPSFNLRLAHGDSTSARPELGWSLIESAPEILWGKRLSLTAGDLRLFANNGQHLFSLPNLDLSWNSPHNEALDVHVRSRGAGGQMLNGELWLSLNGRSQTADGRIEISADTLHYGVAGVSQDSLQMEARGLKLDLSWKARGEESRLDGDIQLGQFRADARGRTLCQFDSLQGLVENWNLRVLPGRGEGLSCEWEISGQIADLRRPTLDFVLKGRSDDCSGLSEWLPQAARLSPSGSLNIAAHFQGDLMSPTVSVDATVGRIGTTLTDLHRVEAQANYAERCLVLNSFRAGTDRGELELAGKLQYQGGWSAELDLAFHGSLPGINRGRIGRLDGKAILAGGDFSLKAGWEAEDDSTAALQMDGRYSRSSDEFRLTAEVPGSPVRADLSIGRLSSQKELHLDFSQPQVIWQKLAISEYLDRVLDLQVDGEVAGPMDKMACRLTILNERTASRLKLSGAFRVPSASSLSFDGDVMLRQGSTPPLEGSVSLALDQQMMVLRDLILDDAITAFAEINLETGEIGPTELRISGWPLERGLQIFAPEIASKFELVLDGRLELYGDLQNPQADLDFYASQGHFREQGNFWAVLSAQLKDQEVRINECNIGQDVVSLAQVSGGMNLESRSLDLNLRSNLADASDLMELFGSNAIQLHGSMNAHAVIRGAWQQPESRLYLTIGRGSVYHLPFDLVDLEALQDSSTNYALILKKFSLTQSPDLELSGEGTLPWNNRPLDMQFALRGNILKIIHQIVHDVPASSGQGELQVQIAQNDGEIHLVGGSLELTGGVLDLPAVVRQIRDLSAQAHFDRNRLVVENIAGEIDDQPFNISNYFNADTSGSGLEHLYFPGADVDLGIVTIRSQGRGILAHIPALMPVGQESYIGLKGKDGQGNFTISGPTESPLMRGSITAANVEFTYPFPPGGKRPSRFVQGVLDVLNSARWDVQILPERDNRYVHELKALESHTVLGDVSEILTTVDIDLNVDPGDSRLDVVGSLKDNSFRFKGKLVSTRGSVEYLDFNFRVEQFEAEFDEYDPLPMVQGRASTVYVDSMGFSRTIYATLYVVDPVTGERRQRGRWGDFVFVLEDDQGSSQEQILAAMGYSPGTITQKVTSLGGTIVSGMVLRGFVRPIERRLEGLLQVDVVRLQPTLAQNLFETEVLGVPVEPISQIGWGAYMLRQSQLTVGKYLTDDVFLSYTGLWKTGINAANERHFGFLHRWNLDYRIRPVSGNLILTFGYEYDSLERLEDRSVALRYSFVF